MIRINLLPVKEKQKKKTRKDFLILSVFMFVLQVVALYSWQGSLDEELIQVRGRNRSLQGQVDNLKKVKQQIEERLKNKALLEAQNYIFDQLKYDKIGPSNLLLFLSYILTRTEDDHKNKEELKKQEMIGWNIEWDVDSVWLVRAIEDRGELTLKGRARAHEDVAELLKRLGSGVFFYKPELDYQERKFHDLLEVHYVEFKIIAELNYNLDGFPKALAGADQAAQ